ncbi:MAG: helix-turn-helix transcriptional regulator [Eubacteriales bacterium]|nr:helix-turn-helix transcriptional regulator [Eubacteriales bacterium]
MRIFDGKDTNNLKQELMTEADIDSYIKNNERYFSERSITDLLAELYERQNISKAELARRAGMSEVYLHQLFSGRRNPSRDKLLCLCVGMGLTLDETQKLLKEAAYVQLYPRIKREAVICHGIIHHTPLGEINDKLFTENEKTLS